MNTQQLLSFIYIADTLSFTKAAKRLYISVPTISRNIKNLESELGVPLISRNKHKVVITSAGHRFYSDAKNILKAYSTAKENVMQASGQTFLNIGCTAVGELNLISRVLETFRKENPDVVPHIEIDNYAKLMTLLTDNTIDLMLGSNYMSVEHLGLDFIPLGDLNSYAIVSRHDPLSEKDSISFSDLDERTLIYPSDKMVPLHSDNRVKNFIATHQKRSKDIECQNEYICFALARAGYGVSLLPKYRIPSKIEGCLSIPLEENEPFTYGVLTLSDKNDMYLRRFIQILKSQFDG